MIFLKLFVTDEIINDMVYQTNLYAEQVLKETQKTKGHVKEWVPTNNREIETFFGVILWMGLMKLPCLKEIETFFGVILWMGLMKLPRLKAYWSTNILYANANKVKEVMPRNRFEQLLRMWHFNNNGTNILYANKVKEVMPRNRFEQLLRMWHFNNNEDKEFANDRVRKLTPLLNK
ncbi:Transposase IS4 [Popillia japonica]|uniref:Transposase IS4 n=1 Tax=Popillia japonica TaxID=7064 RepID=A0AAW1JD19_POPJA